MGEKRDLRQGFSRRDVLQYGSAALAGELLGAAIGLGQSDNPKERPPAPDAMTKYSIALYGAGAAETDGSMREVPGRVYVMHGRQGFTWEVEIPESGDYDLALTCSTDRPGAAVEVQSWQAAIHDTLPKTQGFHYDSNIWHQLNYERIALAKQLRLSAGKQPISFRLHEPIPKRLLYFRALELTPASKTEAIQQEVRRARESRASTDWMLGGGYGLMFHWTSQSLPKGGSHKIFRQAVQDFDLPRFVEMVEGTGARWVLFTVGHAESYCPAPLEAWETLHPGMTADRDLLMELADALGSRNIRLMVYLNSPNMAHMGKVSRQQYLENHRKILTEIGERYKDKIAGYWFDSWYQGYEQYPDFPFEELFQLCKIGSKDRITALNSWLYPCVTPWQDYWAGEANIPGLPPTERIMQSGAGKGLPYHALLTLEGTWVHQDAAGMALPRLSAQYLAGYINDCRAGGGAVTVNMTIYQEGMVGDHSLEVMKEVRRMVRGA